MVNGSEIEMEWNVRFTLYAMYQFNQSIYDEPCRVRRRRRRFRLLGFRHENANIIRYL